MWQASPVGGCAMANDDQIIITDEELLDDELRVLTDLDDYAPGSTAEGHAAKGGVVKGRVRDQLGAAKLAQRVQHAGQLRPDGRIKARRCIFRPRQPAAHRGQRGPGQKAQQARPRGGPVPCHRMAQGAGK